MVSIRKIATALPLIPILSECASVDINKGAANFDENQFAVDLNTCRGGRLLTATFETLKDSTAGVAVSVVRDRGAAVHSDLIEAMIIATATGGVLCAGAAIYNGVAKRQSEISSCLIEKKYTTTHQAS